MSTALGGTGGDRVKCLEALVQELTEALEASRQSDPNHQPLLLPPPNSSSLALVSSSSSNSSSTLPFTIRSDSRCPSDVPILFLIKMTAHYGQLVPLSALTRSSIEVYLLKPPVTLKMESNRKKVSIATLNNRHGPKISLKDFRYSVKCWVDLQREQLKYPVFHCWEALFKKLLEWEKLPDQFDAIVDCVNVYMAQWVGDKHMFKIADVWEKLLSHINDFNMASLGNSILLDSCFPCHSFSNANHGNGSNYANSLMPMRRPKKTSTV